MKKKAQLIINLLNKQVPHPTISLHHTSPYTLLVAVVLSAQCTDARVNQATPHLFKLADTAEKMVQLDPIQIEKIIRPCGLAKTKASAIWRLSNDLIKKHDGQVPCSFKALENLPGVGHKTASVVMAQAFHVPAFPVDTHIFRCARRWGLSSGSTVTKVEKDLKHLFSKSAWITLHLQIITYARIFCPARGHKKASCPICSVLFSASQPNN